MYRTFHGKRRKRVSAPDTAPHSVESIVIDASEMFGKDISLEELREGAMVDGHIEITIPKEKMERFKKYSVQFAPSVAAAAPGSSPGERKRKRLASNPFDELLTQGVDDQRLSVDGEERVLHGVHDDKDDSADVLLTRMVSGKKGKNQKRVVSPARRSLLEWIHSAGETNDSQSLVDGMDSVMESGERQALVDEFEYIMDGITGGETGRIPTESVRAASCVKLLGFFRSPKAAFLIRTCGRMPEVFDSLNGMEQDPTFSLSGCAMLNLLLCHNDAKRACIEIPLPITRSLAACVEKYHPSLQNHRAYHQPSRDSYSMVSHLDRVRDDLWWKPSQSSLEGGSCDVISFVALNIIHVIAKHNEACRQDFIHETCLIRIVSSLLKLYKCDRDGNGDGAVDQAFMEHYENGLILLHLAVAESLSDSCSTETQLLLSTIGKRLVPCFGLVTRLFIESRGACAMQELQSCLRTLINLSNENPSLSIDLGEVGAVDIAARILFHFFDKDDEKGGIEEGGGVCERWKTKDRRLEMHGEFDTLLLTVGFLINMVELSGKNRESLVEAQMLHKSIFDLLIERYFEYLCEDKSGDQSVETVVLGCHFALLIALSMRDNADRCAHFIECVSGKTVDTDGASDGTDIASSLETFLSFQRKYDLLSQHAEDNLVSLVDEIRSLFANVLKEKEKSKSDED
eukprot:TRINITY_DN1996_c0_g1_i2.p2 TRINITY_DN1996_c0_g1~~TRINITY_DN1996_c0_g1_i2.p2  ORF type:complete len:685 (-),score=188.52 TRINITY_DN1996_c0_g1_i2:2614-4668(-)